jgi:hypothetical protein
MKSKTNINICRVTLLAITLAIATSCSGRPDTYTYTAFDESGVKIITGRFTLPETLHDKQKYSGSWYLSKVDGVGKTRHQHGWGKLEAFINGDKIHINLNPGVADDNTWLDGTIAETGISGEWLYESDAGRQSQGRFEALGGSSVPANSAKTQPAPDAAVRDTTGDASPEDVCRGKAQRILTAISKKSVADLDACRAGEGTVKFRYGYSPGEGGTLRANAPKDPDPSNSREFINRLCWQFNPADVEITIKKDGAKQMVAECSWDWKPRKGRIGQALIVFESKPDGGWRSAEITVAEIVTAMK